jgi:hypothetical protein
MKKIKKYIYPFIFSMCFFLTYAALSIVIGLVLPSGDYAGLAYALIALIVWIMIIVPIFCLGYCKLIRKEKYKILFGFYSPLVIALCHTGPFLIPAIPGGDADIVIQIALALFAWMALWTFVPLHIQISADKEKAENG